MQSLINIGIILTYLMIGFATFAAIGFGIKKMLSNQNSSKKTLYSIGGLVLIFIISYLMSSDEILGSYEKYEITSSTAKQVGMGLMTFYILAIVAIGAILYSELSKKFSK